MHSLIRYSRERKCSSLSLISLQESAYSPSVSYASMSRRCSSSKASMLSTPNSHGTLLMLISIRCMYQHSPLSCSTSTITYLLPTIAYCAASCATTNIAATRQRRPFRVGQACVKERINGYFPIRRTPMPCSTQLCCLSLQCSRAILSPSLSG